MKDQYYKALCINNGKLDEIKLGKALGLSDYFTTKIISRLLAEYKIEYAQHRACSYKVIKIKP